MLSLVAESRHFACVKQQRHGQSCMTSQSTSLLSRILTVKKIHGAHALHPMNAKLLCREYKLCILTLTDLAPAHVTALRHPGFIEAALPHFVFFPEP